jgi:serine/threonine protein kinase
MVEHINSMLPATKGLAKYIDVDEDNTTNDIVLLMEYINVMNLRKHIEAFGCLEIEKVKIVTYQILKALRDLKKVGYYHGRLNLNNIHIDNQSKIKLTDYMYMSIIDREAKFSPDEGSRLDIFCLGI